MTFIKKLDDYIVDSLINKGTFGCVYKCHKNSNIYAIKEDSNIKLLKHLQKCTFMEVCSKSINHHWYIFIKLSHILSYSISILAR